MFQSDIFQRVNLLFGKENLEKINKTKVILFGVGGVGSWCAESLVRTGIIHLTIVDFDSIAVSNVNRQLPATTHTIGQSKVEVLKERLLSINPEANITAIQKRYCAETSDSFRFWDYDYVIDAIDNIPDKAHLIRTACETDAVLLSSMGAALKLDPTQIKVNDFWKVTHDPLARALRQQFKKTGIPSRKFQCVYSEERLRNQIPDKANGTVMHVTASFGLTLAGMVINDIISSPH